MQQRKVVSDTGDGAEQSGPGGPLLTSASVPKDLVCDKKPPGSP